MSLIEASLEIQRLVRDTTVHERSYPMESKCAND